MTSFQSGCSIRGTQKGFGMLDSLKELFSSTANTAMQRVRNPAPRARPQAWRAGRAGVGRGGSERRNGKSAPESHRAWYFRAAKNAGRLQNRDVIRACDLSATRPAKAYALQPKTAITFHHREYGLTKIQELKFVFIPPMENGAQRPHYSLSAIGTCWNAAVKRAGIRRRNPYHTRHTFACWLLSAGANPALYCKPDGP